MSEFGFDPVEAQGRDHNEIERLRARVAELEAEVVALKQERDEAKEATRTLWEATGPADESIGKQ